MQPYEDTTNGLNKWVNAINKAYRDEARGLDNEGIDPLYDPRTVFNRISKYISTFNDEFQILNAWMPIVSKHGAKLLDNYLPELTEKAKEKRVQEWRSLFPNGIDNIITNEDLSDIAHLGSRAMANAFVAYFKHHCLSGSLGAALMPQGSCYYSLPKFEEVDIDHEYAFVRVSQRVLSKYLLRKAREIGVESIADYERLRDETKAELLFARSESNKESLDTFTADKINFLHNEMVRYLDELFSLDTSVLREGIVPYISQLDSLHVLRSEKHNGARGRAIFADEMGTGKTLSAIVADAIYRKEGAVKKTLIVCPNHMKDEWRERFQKYLSDEALQSFYGNPEKIKIIKGSASLEHIGDSPAVIANYEMVYRAFSHRTDKTGTLLGLAQQAFENGIEDLVKEDDVFERINEGVMGLRQLNSPGMRERLLKKFSSNAELRNWVGDDWGKALYLEAVEGVLREEGNVISSLFTYGADFLIVDESHAIKNPSSKRSEGIVELLEFIPRLALLTGTLIPNRYEDVDLPLRLVDREYKAERIEKKDPNSVIAPKLRRIRQKLIPYLSRNLREDVSPRAYRITPESEREVEITIDNITHATYRSIIEDSNLNYGDKTRLARWTLLNPVIAINKLHQRGDHPPSQNVLERILDGLTPDDRRALESGTYVPPKYKKISDELLNWEGNAIIFTSHIEGNTRPLENGRYPSMTLIDHLQRASGKSIVLHDGQTGDHKDEGKSERKAVLRVFNKGENVALIASYPTLGEGADLTKGTKVFCLDLPYALPDQPVGRTDRITQTKDLNVMYLLVRDKKLSEGTKSGLTIDESVLQLGKDKKVVSSIIIDGKAPGDEELEIYRRLMNQNGAPWDYTPLRDSLELEKAAKERGEVKSFLVRAGHDGRDSRQNVGSFDEKMMHTYLANMVLNPVDYTHKSNVMIGQLIHPLLREGKMFADIGGGPASLTLAGGVSNAYDIIDPLDWQNVMKIILRERSIPFPENVIFHQSFLSDFKSKGHYDLVTCNNMLKWTSSQAGPGQFSETEGVFRDINGMLATGGRLVLGLPGVYSDDTKQNLELLLLNSGFRDYRIEQVTSPQDSSFHELVALAVKTGLPSPTPVGEFTLNIKYSSGRTSRGMEGKKETKSGAKGSASMFRFGEDSDVRSVLT